MSKQKAVHFSNKGRRQRGNNSGKGMVREKKSSPFLRQSHDRLPSYSGVPTQSFILHVASPKVREHGRTTPLAYELASDTY